VALGAYIEESGNGIGQGVGQSGYCPTRALEKTRLYEFVYEHDDVAVETPLAVGTRYGQSGALDVLVATEYGTVAEVDRGSSPASLVRAVEK